MKGAVSLKTIITLVILVLVGVLGVVGINTVRVYMSGAAGGEGPAEDTVLAKVDEGGGEVTITWKSEKESMGVVEYGTSPASLLLRVAESEAATDHRVVLPPEGSMKLKPLTSYYFRIRVGEEIFDNNGIPYSFKTKAGEELVATPTAMVTTVPQQSSPGGSGSGSGLECDTNKDGRVSSIEALGCSGGSGGVVPTAAATAVPDKCDANKDGRVSSIETLNCK